MRHIADLQTAYCSMTITKNPQIQSEIYQNQEKQRKNKDAHGDVRQDKRAFSRARTASVQPARSDIPMRAQTLTTKTHRTQNPIVDKRRTVQLVLWISPIEKAEVERRAERESEQVGRRISLSSVGAALFRRGLQTDLDMQYGALLTPVFENVLKRYMSARDNRLASLLVRACIAIEQTRSISVNTLGRQPKVTPGVLNEILDRSLEDAKKKITNRSPELKELIKELNSWIVDEES
jgi:hypothetical protein